MVGFKKAGQKRKVVFKKWDAFRLGIHVDRTTSWLAVNNED